MLQSFSRNHHYDSNSLFVFSQMDTKDTKNDVCVGHVDELGLMVDAEVKRCLNGTILYPFLEHVAEFMGSDGKIDEASIAERWTALTNQNAWLSSIKAKITINGANQVLKHRLKGDAKSCPFMARFLSAAHIMPNLKHPCDTGVVNADGSIDANKLKKLMVECFIWDNEKKVWFMPKSSMLKFIAYRGKEDRDVKPLVEGLLMPSWSTVAQNEWIDAFNVYCDGWTAVKGCNKLEPTISAKRLLQFYFNCAALNNDVRKNLLPVSPPVKQEVPASLCTIQ